MTARVDNCCGDPLQCTGAMNGSCWIFSVSRPVSRSRFHGTTPLRPDELRIPAIHPATRPLESRNTGDARPAFIRCLLIAIALLVVELLHRWAS